MLDVKEATRITREYFGDLYADARVSNVLLEEMERGESHSSEGEPAPLWHITETSNFVGQLPEAQEGDLAAITRVKEEEYELRLLDEGSTAYDRLSPYALTFIGNKGKRIGYVENEDFFDIVD